MGMESGLLPLSKIAASSVLDDEPDNYGWQYSRLNYEGKRWVPNFSDNYPWIQVWVSKMFRCPSGTKKFEIKLDYVIKEYLDLCYFCQCSSIVENLDHMTCTAAFFSYVS